MFYEVFIPSNGPDGFDVTITVEADNWMTALKSGLERTGQGADAIRNVMCDIKEDNTIHVTDATTARVFVLREVDGNSNDEAPPPAVDGEAKSTLLDMKGSAAAKGPAPQEEDDVSTFATQKMAPVTSSNFTGPRKTAPPPSGPPPEATGKFKKVSPRQTRPSGQHAPPPTAAPPPAARQSGAIPVMNPASDDAKTQQFQASDVRPPEPEPAPTPAPEPEPEQPTVVIGTPEPARPAPSEAMTQPTEAVKPAPQEPSVVVADEPEQPSVVIGSQEPEQPSVVIGSPDPTPEPEPEQPSVVIGSQEPEPVAASEPVAAPEPEPELVAPPEPVAAPQPEPEPVAPPEPEPVAQPEPTPAPAAAAALATSEAVTEPELPEVPSAEDGLEERSWTSDDGRMRIGSATFEALKRDEPEAKVVREQRHPSGTRKAVQIGRGDESVSENTLEEVFLEINQIHEGDMTMEQVINYVMDLSLAKIRAEAGSIMFADVNGLELYFATARGPKAQEVMDFRVPMGVGLVGFCAREGVSLAISDAEKDPRFFAEISEKLGYPTKNVLCAPVQFEGRVYGAIELMNKSQPFTNTEVNVLTYIGRQLAKFVNDLIMAREKI